MSRHVSVTLVVAMVLVVLLAGCGAPAPEVSKQRDEVWAAQQLQTFQRFKNEPTQRAAIAESVARAFPSAFDEAERLDVSKMDGAPDEARLIELLGEPNVSFSLVERPEHLGGVAAQQLDLDPRELHVLLYDVGCLVAPTDASEAELCPYIEALALTQSVLRVRVIRDRRADARRLLTPRPPEKKRQAASYLDVAQPGWKKLEPTEAAEIAKRLPEAPLDFTFYRVGEGDVMYGRLLSPLQLTQVSVNQGVCTAAVRDVIIPALSEPVPISETAPSAMYRDADVAIVVFANNIEVCEQRYRAGQFVVVRGERLSPSELLDVNDLFARRFGAECDIPARRVSNGLMQATGGIYQISVRAPEWVTSKWSSDAVVEFLLSPRETYVATLALRPWGVWIKECSARATR